jgi:hypothetical protein
MANEKKKMETSKKIIWASYIITGILSTVVIVGTFLGYDVESIATLAGLAFGETSISNAFYFRKSAKENVPKIIASLPREFQEMVDINQLLSGE